jgi:hypothetical protein
MSQETSANEPRPALVGLYGQALQVERSQCPGCGGTDAARQKGFGGFWKDMCKGCGCVVAEGRGE